jgi:DNA processing protein
MRAASLFPEAGGLSAHEKRSMRFSKRMRPVISTKIVEQLEPELSSSEIFAALFERELAGEVRQLPGKNFVRTF